MDAHTDSIALCLFKMVRGIDLYIQTDGFLWCTLQAQSFGFVPSLTRCPGLKPEGEGLGVVLEQDDAGIVVKMSMPTMAPLMRRGEFGKGGQELSSFVIFSNFIVP